MKYLFCLTFSLSLITAFAQSDQRKEYQKELEKLTSQLAADTDAQFQKGAIFIFNEPYKAVMTKDASFYSGSSANRESVDFKSGDELWVVGTAAVGGLKKIKAMNSDKLYDTKAFGRPGFDIVKADDYKAQVSKIKSVEWKEAEALTQLLSCGNLAEVGYANFEKHNITFGDTPVFFQVRGENNKILLHFMLKTYGGNDFKNMGPAIPEKSFVEFTFTDGTKVKSPCIGEGPDNTFAIVDITDLKNKIQSGITAINFSLKKTKSKELTGIDQFAVGLKMDCIKF